MGSPFESYAKCDEDLNTDLHYSAAHNRPASIQTALKAGIKNIDAENYMGWTPLMMAARNGNLEVVKLLIENRADATKKNFHGASVFVVAIASGDLEVVTFLLKHLLCGGVSRQSMETIISPFVLALLFEHTEVVNYLLLNSFNINATAPSTGTTPIMITAVQNHLELFNLLIAHGADVLAKDINGKSASDIMYENNFKELARTPAQIKQCRRNRRAQKKRDEQRVKEEEKKASQQQPPDPVKVETSNDQQYANLQWNDTNARHCEHNPLFYNQDNYCEYIPGPHFYSAHAHKPVPMLYISPHPVLLSPHPSEMQQQMKKSPGVPSPWCVMSPNYTPVMPNFGCSPQMFFPPDFSANSMMSPFNVYQCPSDSLLQISGFPSPVPANFAAYSYPPKIEDHLSHT